MSKSRNRNRRKFKDHQDITVNDFANASALNTRKKKPTSNVNFDVQTHLEIKDNWDDESSGDEVYINNFRRRRKQCNISESKDKTGNDYPLDVWFLIANYIRPEDVGKFASICKTSLEVVMSAQFWIALYKRYYNKKYLPEEFTEVFLMRYCGVRTFVIKALFHMYPPFICKSISTGLTHPDILKGKKCIAMSFKKEGKVWCYYFKFKLNKPMPFYRRKPEDIIELLNDIHLNSEEDNCILKVVSNECIALVPVIGQTLRHASFNLSTGFRHYKLQLVFSSQIENFYGKNGIINGDTIIMDPVSKVTFMNWWHPMYLSDSKIPRINQE